MQSDLVIVGAGIAGLSAARLLHDAGHKVLVVARELGEASRVPDALLNPVRGKRGTVAPEAEEALEALWDFYPRYTTVHPGILRPVPKPDREEWKRKLAERSIAHHWTEEGLYLENGGWLETAPLLARLAAGLNILNAEVLTSVGSTLYLSDNRQIKSQTLIHAGGASGAHLVGLGGRFTAGSVLITGQTFEQARSYGVYVAGHSLGGSYLPHASTYTPHTTQPHEVEWLLSEAGKLLGHRPGYQQSWSGVRYRLDQNYLKPIPGGFALTGFGSAAYFYAPLYAQRLVKLI